MSVTALNTAAVGDKIVRTEDGAYIVINGTKTALDMTAAANSGLALLRPHSTITVAAATSPGYIMATSFGRHAPSLQSAAQVNGGGVNQNAAWSPVATSTTTYSTVANILSGLATFETAFEGHA